MSKQLINFDFLDREASLYHSAKTTIEDNNKIIHDTIKKNTEQEYNDVNNAIKKLNDKIDTLMKNEFIKDKQTTIESANTQMKKSIEVASKTFFKVKKIIYDKQDLSLETKKKFEKKLYDKIINKFMTEEEKQLFEQLMKSGNIIIMGGNNKALKYT